MSSTSQLDLSRHLNFPAFALRSRRFRFGSENRKSADIPNDVGAVKKQLLENVERMQMLPEGAHKDQRRKEAGDANFVEDDQGSGFPNAEWNKSMTST